MKLFLSFFLNLALKLTVALFIFLMTPLGHAKEVTRRYLVPNTLRSYLPTEVNSRKHLLSYLDYSLVSLTPQQAAAYSQTVHERNHTCGGFIDVEEEVQSGISFQKLVKDLKQHPLQMHSIDDNFGTRLPKYMPSVLKALQKTQQSRYISELKSLVAFPNRSAKTENGREAAAWILNRFKEMAQGHVKNPVTFQTIQTGSSYKQSSVVIRIHGSSPNKGAVVIGAHMDTFPRNRPGADDDASGVAAVLEIFNTIISTNQSFERDMYFIAYAAEEVGLVGSNKVATYFQNQKIPVRAVFQLDMIGYKPARDQYDMYFVTDFVDQGLTNFSKLLTTKYLGIPQSKIGEFRCGYGCSDHASWTRKGFKSATPFETSKRQMNRAIHTSRDTIDALDMTHAMKYVKLGMSFMIELAEPI